MSVTPQNYLRGRALERFIVLLGHSKGGISRVRARCLAPVYLDQQILARDRRVLRFLSPTRVIRRDGYRSEAKARISHASQGCSGNHQAIRWGCLIRGGEVRSVR
jgi:hypothetical protein